MITYEEACDIVFSAKKFGICLGLERMELMLKELGNPEQKIPAIHLAGTNGKGSTLTYLKAMFIEAGYNVGTYTSPAINKINDKIQINGEQISDQQFAILIEQMKPVIEKIGTTSVGAPTEFEILTAMAFQYFATVRKPDIVLIETGLGGRLDSTNVITPLLSIITSIGHDHMDLLGNTIAEVAGEKAGIIKKAVPVVSGCKQAEAIQVMQEHSYEQKAELYQLGNEFFCKQQQSDCFDFTYNKQTFTNLKTGMLGTHQQENAALAIMAVLRLVENGHFQLNETDIRSGLAKAKIANRIEIVQRQPTIIFDGGHNREGIEALSRTLVDTFRSQRITVLFCAMRDKDIKSMLQPLIEVASEIILTSFPYERAMDPHEVYEEISDDRLKVIGEWKEAYSTVISKLSANEVFVVTGSLYFLNHIRIHLEK